MTLLPGPNWSTPPAKLSNCSKLSTSSRTIKTFFFWSLRLTNVGILRVPEFGISSSKIWEIISFYKRTSPPQFFDSSLTFLKKQQPSNWLEIWSKTVAAMVVLPIPPMPQIPTTRKSNISRDNNDLTSSMCELIPTRPLESLEGDISFNFFKTSLTISSTSLDSGLSNVKNKQ